ncbi:nitrous oxide reductase accessory protein NosL [Pseudomonadota bacterium]
MLKKYVSRLMLISAVLVLAACSEEKVGPEDIEWDRDSCSLCRMFVSDAQFAAEVRGGEKRELHKFDDIGCAVNWLNRQPWAADETTEIWVAAYTSTRENVVWLDAREARYVEGAMSPMNYGLKAEAPMSPLQGIGFVEMTTRILADKPNHICVAPTMPKVPLDKMGNE